MRPGRIDRHIVSASALLVLFATALGCARAPGASTPTLFSDLGRLQEEVDLLPPFPEPLPESGSLWTDAGPGAALVRDTRAYRLNDLLRVRLVESTSGSNEASTDLARDSDASVTAPFVFGLEMPNVLNTESSTDFAGDGRTERSSMLSGNITVRVMRVLPNGDLIVAGQKTVMVNRERQILTLVGSVRPEDVDADNRVSSSVVGDLTVRMWGRGEIDDTVRQGWFMRIMNRIWPF